MRRSFILRIPIVLCGLAAAAGALWWVHSGRSEAVDRAGIGGFDVAVVMAVVGLLAWWWAGRIEPASDDLGMAADYLARTTAKQWERESRRWGISVPVKVTWSWDEDRSLQPDEVMSGAALTLDAQVVGRIHDELYSRLDHGQLVILGEAGAGKTAAMILLVREALARRSRMASAEDRMLQPVPVWLTLGGWNPARTSLTGYAVETLERAYPALRSPKYGERAAFRLVDEDRVAFFLDGLDEMPEAAQAVALVAIDDQSVLKRVVITSRLAGYLRAREGGRLTYPAIVGLLPVDTGAAADYLARGHDLRETRETFQQFADWLRSNDQSQTAVALRTPLALTLVRSAYADRADPHDLTGLATAEEVMQAIIGQFLVMAYPDPRQREAATFWLGWTARQMGPGRDLVWWDVAAWIEPRWLALSEIGYYAATVTPISTLVGWYLFGPVIGILALLSPLFLIPTALGPIGPRRTNFQPIALAVRLPTARQAAILGVASAVVAAVAGAGTALVRMITGPQILGMNIYPGMVSALSVLLVIYFVLLTAVFTTPSGDEPAATPASLRRADLRSSGLMVTCGLLLGLVFGALTNVLAPGVGFVEAFSLGACAGLAMSLSVLGTRSSTLPVRSAGRWISGAYDQPPAKVSFPRLFEDALQRQVLRQAGPIYQFRHAQLQDHLREAFIRQSPDGSDLAQKMVPPPENPLSLTGLQLRLEAATRRGEAGDPTGAVEDLRALLADQNRVLGRRHVDLYDTLAAIARFEADLGDAGEALRAAEELVRYSRRMTLGLSNASTLESRALLALRKAEAGLTGEAIADFRRICRDADRLLGPGHRQTLEILETFSRVLGGADEFAEAATSMERYVAGCQSLFGPEHPATLRGSERLAYCLANAGQSDRAVEIMDELVPRLAQVFGPDSAETFVGRFNLACFRGSAGDPTRAAGELEQLAADVRAARGDDEEWIAQVELEAAEQHSQAGQIQTAQSLFAGVIARMGETSPLGSVARERLTELQHQPAQ